MSGARNRRHSGSAIFPFSGFCLPMASACPFRSKAETSVCLRSI